MLSLLGLRCKREELRIPHCLLGLDGDDARLLVVNVVALMLEESHGYGCINILVHVRDVYIVLWLLHNTDHPIT